VHIADPARDAQLAYCYPGKTSIDVMALDGAMVGRKSFKVFNQDFVVDDRYVVTKELGQGAYGIVCAATNTANGEGVAIKKVTNVFSKKILAKRALRELKLLQHFRGHRNITCLFDMDIPKPDNFNEVYLYEELMECDLAAIIRSGQPLTDAHFQSFITRFCAA